MRKIFWKRKKLNHRGMTLVEVIVAVAILSVVVAPTLRIFASTGGTNLQSRKRQRATSVAEATMETFKAYNVEQLCRQFLSNSFKGVVASADGVHTTTMSAAAIYGGTETYPLHPDGTLRDDADSYKFHVANAASEGQFYDVDILVKPNVSGAPNVLSVEDISPYSDAIICLEESEGADALAKLQEKAEQQLDANFSSYHSNAASHTIDSVSFDDFKRVIDVNVSDTGAAQTVEAKVTYTCKATVSYSYITTTGSTGSGSKTYDETLLKYEQDMSDDGSGATTKEYYNNAATIGGVEVDGRKGKLRHIYLYYFPTYPSASLFGSSAKDEINLNGSLTNLYSPSGVADPEESGYEALQFVVAKQLSTGLTDAQLNIGEVGYNVRVSNTVTGGEVELKSNLYENLAPLGSAIAPPVISGFSSGETVRDSVVDRVVLLYDVEVHVYEAGTTDEVATFIGTMNE